MAGTTAGNASVMDFRGPNGFRWIAHWAQDIDSITGHHQFGMNLDPRLVPTMHDTGMGKYPVSNDLLVNDVIKLVPVSALHPMPIPATIYRTVAYDGQIYPTAAEEICLLEGDVLRTVPTLTKRVILTDSAQRLWKGRCRSNTPSPDVFLSIPVGRIRYFYFFLVGAIVRTCGIRASRVDGTISVTARRRNR